MAKSVAAPIGDSVPPFGDNGVEHVVAANKGGQALQGALVTQVGAAPFTLVFADHGLADMADTNYVVVPVIEGATPSPDESTKSTTSVDILGGSAADVINVLIFGRQAGMSPDGSDL